VSSQRVNKRKPDRGERWNMRSAEQAASLAALGFAWERLKAPE
jgi:hypothetical protein